MLRTRPIAILFCALASTACSSGPPAAPAPAPAPGGDLVGPVSESAPVPEAAAPADVLPVSAAQAERGQFAFLASCTGCHASSEFTDTAFKTRWSSRSAADLYDILSATMPEDMPNSLPPQRYVEIVAYLLELNGFETADEGATWDISALSNVSLARMSSR